MRKRKSKSKKNATSLKCQNLMVFWVGLLTGAVFMASLFTYQTYKADNYQDALVQLQLLEQTAEEVK